MKHEDIDHTGLTGVGGLESGTSFPGSPSDDDLFYRSDRGLLYFYNAATTSWLTVEKYRAAFAMEGVTGAVSPQQVGRVAIPTGETWHLLTFDSTTHVSTTNNGSNFQTIELLRTDSANTSTSVVSHSTAADAANTWVQHSTAIGADLNASALSVKMFATKTGAPGTMNVTGFLIYRLKG